jgi:hypothetical protein
MRVTFQILEPRSEYFTRYAKHNSMDLATFKTDIAVDFALRSFFGYTSKVKPFELKATEKGNHNSDFFAIVHVDYATHGKEPFDIIQIDGKTGEQTKTVGYKNATVIETAKVRVDIKLDKKYEKGLSRWQKFIYEWKFKRYIKGFF